MQFCGKVLLSFGHKGDSKFLYHLTSGFDLSSHPNQSFQPQIPFDGKYVHWAYWSRMASLARLVNDHWEYPVLGSSQLKGICMCISKCIWSCIWNLLSKVAAGVCVKAKGRRVRGGAGGQCGAFSGRVIVRRWLAPRQQRPRDFSGACAITSPGRPYLLLPPASTFPLLLSNPALLRSTNKLRWHGLKNFSIPPTTRSSFSLQSTFWQIFFI